MTAPTAVRARSVLVTGGAGFIGSHVCDALVAEGLQVRCLDVLVTGKRSNIAELERAANFSFIHGDIRDPLVCVEAVRGTDAVVHLAALGSVPRSIADPVASEATNLLGTLLLLEACRRHGQKRIIFASSSSVYGDSPQLPKQEGQEGHPLSPYAVTKAMDEAYAALYHRLFGLDTIGLRFFNVFGERQDPDGPYAAAIPRFVLRMLAHRPPQVHGDGHQTRDFTHVANAVHAVRCALAVDDPVAYGRVYNIAFGGRTDLLQLIGMLRDALARTDPSVAGVGVEHGPARQGDVRDSLADITQARQVLGFEPQVDLATGLARTVDWYRSRSGQDR
ncbi:MAG: GDP-mannose 4,6-dehydratase [Flavobacteriales bacterium]|nr:GDP-mannose 4,6-dehydratase [Flavobacteriales bacterium]